MTNSIWLFSDLDGCLLNKSDYSFRDAVPTLKRIRDLGIPLVLASSKTEAEMRVLADEMQLADAPLICENGGVVFWSRLCDSKSSSENQVVLGAERRRILEVLASLKSKFKFESFSDMQLAGVCAATDLPRERAAAALQRACTEPLRWLDGEGKLDGFRDALTAESLTFTRGGRFWHVAGRIDKGAAMKHVIERVSKKNRGQIVSVAIGDSPIDQGMLNVADYPIGIPAPDGLVHVNVAGKNGRVARQAGAAGWAEAVSQVLDELL